MGLEGLAAFWCNTFSNLWISDLFRGGPGSPTRAPDTVTVVPKTSLALEVLRSGWCEIRLPNSDFYPELTLQVSPQVSHEGLGFVSENPAWNPDALDPPSEEVVADGLSFAVRHHYGL